MSKFVNISNQKRICLWDLVPSEKKNIAFLDTFWTFVSVDLEPWQNIAQKLFLKASI